MADLVLLTPRPADDSTATSVLPALALLPHRVRVLGPDPGALLDQGSPDLVLVDAVPDLLRARSVLRTLAAMELGIPVLAVLGEAGLAVVDDQWPLQDLLHVDAGPAEVGARLRLALSPLAGGSTAADHTHGTDRDEPLRVADVVVDEAAWTVRAGGRTLDLTYKEFELLRYLVGHAGRVVTRSTLLEQVWGEGYYGGTRTVDVHIRRLRAKLGPEHEALIGTIRGVGYRFSGAGTAER